MGLDTLIIGVFSVLLFGIGCLFSTDMRRETSKASLAIVPKVFWKNRGQSREANVEYYASIHKIASFLGFTGGLLLVLASLTAMLI